MLDKVKPIFDYTTNVAYNGQYAEYWPYNEYTYLSTTANKTWKYKIRVNALRNSNSASAYIYIYVGGTKVEELNITNQTSTVYYFEVDATTGDEIKINWQQGATWNSYKICFNYAYIDYLIQRFNETKEPYLYPETQANIWSLNKFVLYWNNPNNNTFYGGLMIKKDTTATTGSITLWNAVWFIVVNFNWELLKIPYYS